MLKISTLSKYFIFCEKQLPDKSTQEQPFYILLSHSRDFLLFHHSKSHAPEHVNPHVEDEDIATGEVVHVELLLVGEDIPLAPEKLLQLICNINATV